ncbi:MAG TPA: TatD family hydrolase [Candidatus Paceibacterota bacterium]
MEFQYFDAHSHVQDKDFDKDREDILDALAWMKIGTVAVGTDLASSEAAVALAQRRDPVFAAVGQHPTDTDEAFDETAFARLAREPRVVAVGECGLDYFRTDDVAAARAKQVPLFEAQIALAAAVKKPLMIHARPSRGTMDAYREILDMLTSAKREYGDALTANLHFFAGGLDEARAFLGLGFTLSFTAVLTFARDYDEVVRFAPLDRILAETDAPYVAPAPNRGRRNDPRAVQAVVAALAGIRAEEEEVVRQATVENTIRILRL